MLSVDDNETLSQIGPGSRWATCSAGTGCRRCCSRGAAAPDCPPVRVRLLGEDLIAFRDTTSGKVGLVDALCPHRGASLFFGRNEEEGLRCVYHGWKFDVTGACVDMPSAAEGDNFKSKVRVRAYPTLERGGMIWAYMGPAERYRRSPASNGSICPGPRLRDQVLRVVQLPADAGGRVRHRPLGLPAQHPEPGHRASPTRSSGAIR